MGCFTGDAVSPLSLPLFEEKQHNCYLKKSPFDSSKENKISVPKNKGVCYGGGGVWFDSRTNFAKVEPPLPF